MDARVRGNVAAAIVLGATHPKAANRIYNVGEQYTPTVAERLEWLPPSRVTPEDDPSLNFAQNIAYDTSRIRDEPGYQEIVPERDAMLETLRSAKGR